MIRRQCPNCGKDWYSAVTKPWKCEGCGYMLDDRHNRELDERQSRPMPEGMDWLGKWELP
jgi:tRNA(Ile2) C34 agmatinyltransferase TiaS